MCLSNVSISQIKGLFDQLYRLYECDCDKAGLQSSDSKEETFAKLISVSCFIVFFSLKRQQQETPSKLDATLPLAPPCKKKKFGFFFVFVFSCFCCLSLVLFCCFFFHHWWNGSPSPRVEDNSGVKISRCYRACRSLRNSLGTCVGWTPCGACTVAADVLLSSCHHHRDTAPCMWCSVWSKSCD